MPATQEGRDAARAEAGGDLLAAGLGLAALGLLAASPWLVDRSGPEPFHKGPLIFPLIALAVMLAGALPAVVRLAASWRRGGLRAKSFAVPWPASRLLLLMCLFPWGLTAIGLEAATLLFVFAGLQLVGWRHPLAAGAIGLVLATILHLAFKGVLDIWFPEPLAWRLLLDGAP